MILGRASHTKYVLVRDDVSVYFDSYNDTNKSNLHLRFNGLLVGFIYKESAEEFKTKMEDLENEN